MKFANLSMLGGLAVWIAGLCPAPAQVGVAIDTPQGMEILTRGPVHEAFASTVLFDPEPGIVVNMRPPDPIEELPPSQKPVGDNVAWIPGYWGWDDDQRDFLWISGVWRNLPPGREWVPGYWSEVAGGFQWTSGYWADAEVRQVTYLPAPPATLEVGPSVAAPTADHSWIPGSWFWRETRYVWRPGYWIEVRDDWAWSPSYYSWTPRGYVHVSGFWDYAVPRRGIIFAPVHFTRPIFARPGFYYSPSVVISLTVFREHLFLRPKYRHYYFGDYYAPRYRTAGYYAPHHFHRSRRGYEPIYAHHRWQNRGDRNWDRRWSERYDHRFNNESARPPRTWAALQQRPDRDRRADAFLADTLANYSARADAGNRFQPVSREARDRIVAQRQEIGRFREERQTRERAAGRGSPQARGPEVATDERRRSPLVGRGARPEPETRGEGVAGRGSGAVMPGRVDSERPQAARGPVRERESRTVPGQRRESPSAAQRPQIERPQAEGRPAPQTLRREPPQAQRPTPQPQRAQPRPAPEIQRPQPQRAQPRPAPQVQRPQPQRAQPRPAPQVQRQQPQRAQPRPAPQVQRPQPQRAQPRPAPQVQRPQPQRAQPRPAPHVQRPQPQRAQPRPAPQVQRQQPQRAQPRPAPQVQRTQPQRGGRPEGRGR